MTVTNITLAGIDLSSLQNAKSPAEALATIPERMEVFYDHYLNTEIPAIAKSTDFYLTLLSRVVKGEKLDEVERSILDPNTKPIGLVGTDFGGIGGLCKREGDYDFVITGLMPVAYEGLKRGTLSRAAYLKMLNTLFTVKGNDHQIWTSMGGCRMVKETENHVLMIESARILTNQLMAKEFPGDAQYDNDKNGNNEWMLKHLKQFLQKDFEEYNSRPYQGYALMPIMNLVSYAENPKVVTAAKMVLDYLSAKFAVQSSQLRRSAPICRQEKYAKRQELFNGDHLPAIMSMLSGNTEIYRANDPSGEMTYGTLTAMLVGQSAYRPEPMVLDLMIDTDRELDLVVRHDAVESYYKGPKFTLSAGGMYLNRWDAGIGKRDGWAYPTALIPHQGTEVLRENLLRFDGANDEKLRVNLCQYKNMACGMNLRMPKNLPESCVLKKDGWTFINYDSAKCPLKYGYYVAIKTDRYPKPGLFQKRFASNYGVFEALDSDKASFEQFVTTTLKNNAKRKKKHFGSNYYQTYDGSLIEYNPGNANLNYASIIKVNNKTPYPAMFKDWKFFLQGNYMNATGSGLIIIKNEKLGQQMVLDYRDEANPKRYTAPL